MISDVSGAPPIQRNWWLFLVMGVLSVATAVAVVVWPDLTLLALGIITGIYLLLAALMEIIDAVTGDPGGRAVSAILGAIALIAGVVCIRRPGESLLAIVVVLGVYLVAAGVIRVVRAFDVREGRGWALLRAVVDVAVGCILLSWPDLGLAAVAIIFAASMLIRGVFAIVVAFKLRGMHDEEEPPSVHAGLAT
jgi:uncharacterized membrane protein HdeD (DUF308 family)